MEFQILGPLAVSNEGVAIPLGGAKQRALFALLLLHRNQAVSSDLLIEELWHGEPPETARKALQVHVSNLRKALGADRIATQAPGYCLRTEPGELDLERFEELRAQESADGMREALALWRGPPLSDLAYEPFAQLEIGRLEELRLTCLERRIDADLALGRHAELVAELERLVASEPLRERPRAQLMLALYRSGRQTDALAAYQDARRALVEELGIEPGRSLRELEKAILQQDEALDSFPPLARREDPQGAAARGVAPLVGREQELGQLLAALEDALAGAGRVVLLGGDPGIGKTRLTEELSVRARERGVRVLVGRAWEAGGAPAYWPWVQALRAYLRELGPSALRSRVHVGAAELAELLPDLRNAIPDVPEALPLESESARFRLFDAVASFLRASAREEPIALVLDDLHAADLPSLLLLGFLAGELGSARILVLGAYRELELDASRSRTIAELARLPVTKRLLLTGLEPAAVASIIETTTGVQPAEGLITRIHAQTEGNPLFVGEVAGLLASEGRLEDASTWRLTVPQGVREVIGRRLGHLTEACLEALRVAAVLGREFRLDALEGVAGLGEDDLSAVIEESGREHVLMDAPDALGRMRFTHMLIRETLYAELGTPRRIRLHRRVGKTLERLYGESVEAHVAELAHHFLEAAPGGDAEKAIDYARRAGERATALSAFEEAERLYGMALQALELTEVAGEHERCLLLLALGDAQGRAGDMVAAKETFRRAASIAAANDLPEELSRAALGYGGRFVWLRAGGDRHIVPLLEAALEAVGPADSRPRAKLLARLAGALRDEQSIDRRADLSRQAVLIARRLGEPETLAYTLDSYAELVWPKDAERWLDTAAEIGRLSSAALDRERVLAAGLHRIVALTALGHMAALDRELEVVTHLAEELRQPAQAWIFMGARTMRSLLAGRFEEAEALIGEGIKLGNRAQNWDAGTMSRIQLFGLRREQGRLSELAATLEQAVDEYPTRPVFRCILANAYLHLDQPDQARAILDVLGSQGFTPLSADIEWFFGHSLLAEVCGRVGHAGWARELYEILAPYASYNVINPPELALGSASRYLGILAATMERYDDACRHFQAALAMNDHMGARPEAAHTACDHAQTLLAMGDDGDRERIRNLLERALATARELDMAPLVERASALLSR